MNHSNWTLKFARNSRDIYGYPVRFDSQRNPDKLVGIIGVLAFVFIVGVLVGEAL